MAPRLVMMGGGRMGSALVGGLLASGWSPREIHVVDKLRSARSALADRHPGVDVTDTFPGGDAAVLAVKPDDAEEASRALTGTARVLSIVAGLPTARLETWLGGTTEVVRAMPNTPALVRAGASGLSGGSRASEATLRWAEGLLESVGVVVRVSEDLLDAVTGLSGSGPAYVFVLAEALAEAGTRNGLNSEASRTLAFHTIAGSARLLLDTGQAPADLREAVTSPGGTTAAGLSVLESRSVKEAFEDAVAAAARRSAELGRS